MPLIEKRFMIGPVIAEKWPSILYLSIPKKSVVCLEIRRVLG